MRTRTVAEASDALQLSKLSNGQSNISHFFQLVSEHPHAKCMHSFLAKIMAQVKYDWVPQGGLPSCLQFKHQTRVYCRTKEDGNAWKTAFYLCLIVLIFLDSTAARPMNSRRKSRRGPKPKWVNPCGINTNFIRNHALQGHHEVIPLSDRELMQNVILAARNALIHSNGFKDSYVQKSFSAPSWQDHHQTWKDQRLRWLPSWSQIPKHLHEQLEQTHLKQLRMDTSLSKMYSYLQKIAVGLEQVVLDQAVYDGDFIMEFNEAEYKLKAVLCELQVAMLERGIQPEEDVSREIMTSDVRDIEDTSYRNLRDWYIYRDYMNGLEYVIHSFDHLKDQAK